MRMSRRLFLAVVLALVGSLALTVANGVAQIADTQVTLSCNDGHSVIFAVDQIALTSLVADVQSINASGSGLVCTLGTASADPSTETAVWTVYDYNPSNQAIAPRNSRNKMPATTVGDTTTFQFLPSIYTALLTTNDSSLTGDLSGKTLNAMIQVSGSAVTFMSRNTGGCSNPSTVRFYFRSPSASGSSFPPPGQPINGLPPAGFYTQFWWSNPVSVPLIMGDQPPALIKADMSNPAEWSDWDGQSGANPLVTQAFIQATMKVQTIGLSFGGGCFFENGVTAVDPPETFSSTFTETP